MPVEATVRPSSIPRAGLGVFANKLIPRGVNLGVYMGKKTNTDDLKNNAYAWEVCLYQSLQLLGVGEMFYSLVDQTWGKVHLLYRRQ